MLSIDAKFWGVVVMGGAVIILFFLPWLDTCPVKSIRYRPDWHKYLYAVFVINFLILDIWVCSRHLQWVSAFRRLARCSTSASSC
jgi:quinol-cytochrome oxidoreductase complex cytochrome b subunit